MRARFSLCHRLQRWLCHDAPSPLPRPASEKNMPARKGPRATLRRATKLFLISATSIWTNTFLFVARVCNEPLTKFQLALIFSGTQHLGHPFNQRGNHLALTQIRAGANAMVQTALKIENNGQWHGPILQVQGYVHKRHSVVRFWSLKRLFE